MARRADTDPRRVYRSLAGETPKRTIGLVRLAGRKPTHLAEQFAATLRRASESATGCWSGRIPSQPAKCGPKGRPEPAA